MGISIVDSNGMMRIVGFDTVRIAETKSIGGSIWYREVMSDISVDRYYQKRVDGVYILDGDSARLVYKYAANAGDRYLGNFDTITVKSVSQSVTVPYGTFQTYVYQWPNGAVDYMAPGVGFVRGDFPNTRTELVSATLH